MNEQDKQIFLTKSRKIGSKVIGLTLIICGIIVIKNCLYPSETIDFVSSIDLGGRVAFGFFLIMLGMPFFFPDLLQGSNGSTPMRIVVFMIVSVFAIITIKLGWSIERLSEFSIDKSWIYIIIAALGGQVTQDFIERKYK